MRAPAGTFRQPSRNVAVLAIALGAAITVATGAPAASSPATAPAVSGSAVSGSAVSAAADIAAALRATAAFPVARQVLPAGDGWGSAQGGVTGGSAATAANTHVVSSRSQLVAALGSAADADFGTPRIIYVRGRIDGNTDAEGRPLTCDDYAAGTGYTLPAYLAAYDPATWGRTTDPSGPLENARIAAAAKQAAQVQIPVGPNTTIIGLGDSARIVGANLILRDVDNVIVRNIRFSDAADCFPEWTPTDGATGNWNSAYDSVTLITATHVWLDHNTFTDRPNLDSGQPTYFDRPYQVHDGAGDIIRGSDFVTVSWNSYQDHDKTMLIGSTNTPTADRGKLHVTVHHNEFDTVLQRAPRVRFGQVDVYNNLYRIPSATGYSYSWGVGVESAIVAEKNVLRFGRGPDDGVTPDAVIYDWGGTAIRTAGNLVAVGRGPALPVDLLAAYNATHDPDLSADVGWTPTLRAGVHPAHRVEQVVHARAGAGRLGAHG